MLKSLEYAEHKMDLKSHDMIDSSHLNTELFSQAIASEAAEAQCVVCKAVEFIIPLDLALDEAFIANYLCDECDEAGAAP